MSVSPFHITPESSSKPQSKAKDHDQGDLECKGKQEKNTIAIKEESVDRVKERFEVAGGEKLRRHLIIFSGNSLFPGILGEKTINDSAGAQLSHIQSPLNPTIIWVGFSWPIFYFVKINIFFLLLQLP